MEKLSLTNQRRVGSMLRAGLEYGDNDRDGQMDNVKIQEAFPELYRRMKTSLQDES
jgi:hypothetical protein